jgi:hypothetical protein
VGKEWLGNREDNNLNQLATSHGAVRYSTKMCKNII